MGHVIPKLREESEILKLVSARLWDMPCQSDQNPILYIMPKVPCLLHWGRSNMVQTDGSTPTG